jgi:hypothetical protein
MSRDRAIWDAYADVDMSKPCPGCGASADTWCTNEITGRVRRVPCPTRPRYAGSGLHLRCDPSDADNVSGAIDFTEPRHHDDRTYP